MATTLSRDSLGKAILAILLLAGLDSRANAIEIEEVLWGFDGTCPSRTFIPLNVLIFNEHPVEFRGSLTLRKSMGIGGIAGAPQVTPISLAPGQRSWVKFYIFLDTTDFVSNWNWSLRWRGSHSGGINLNAGPTKGTPARVVLVDRSDLSEWKINLYKFPERLFPPIVTATDALDEVLLDHVPTWQRPQRLAFHDWLIRGGRVHVFHGPAGTFPRFPPLLAELNDPASPRRVGAGWVMHHACNRLDANQLEPLGHATVDGEKQPSTVPTNAPQTVAEPDASQGLGAGSEFFSRFRRMVTPDFNWIVIFLLGGVFLLSLFPGGWILGARRVDFRVILGYLVSMIVLFSVTFSLVGARGYGEASTVNCVAIAHSLDGDQWDVTQWTGLFVTKGDRYEVTHDGLESQSRRNSGQLYATPVNDRNNQAVAGTISNGLSGRFEMEIAPYSMQLFLQRMKATGPHWSITIRQFKSSAGGISNVSLVVHATDSPTISSAYLQHGSMIYQLTPGPPGPDGVPLTTPRPFRAVSHLVSTVNRPVQPTFAPFFFGEEEKTAEQLYQETVEPLLIQAVRETQPVQVTRQAQQKPFSKTDVGLDHSQAPSPEKIRLFLLSDIPRTFRVDDADIGRQAGHVLYVLDVLTETAP